MNDCPDFHHCHGACIMASHNYVVDSISIYLYVCISKHARLRQGDPLLMIPSPLSRQTSTAAYHSPGSLWDLGQNSLPDVMPLAKCAQHSTLFFLNHLVIVSKSHPKSSQTRGSMCFLKMVLNFALMFISRMADQSFFGERVILNLVYSGPPSAQVK